MVASNAASTTMAEDDIALFLCLSCLGLEGDDVEVEGPVWSSSAGSESQPASHSTT
jgi:hypothetical protein